MFALKHSVAFKSELTTKDKTSLDLSVKLTAGYELRSETGVCHLKSEHLISYS